MTIVVDGVEYTAAKIKAMDDGEYEHLLSRSKMPIDDNGETSAAIVAARSSKKAADTEGE